jgi:ribonuclease P protein component
MLIAPTRACADRPEWIRRLGITASRKVGNAVVRNRIKRGIREWFRSSRASFEGDFDVVVIARRGASQLRGDELGSGLSALIAQLNTQLDTHLTTALNTQLKTKRSGPARETAHG